MDVKVLIDELAQNARPLVTAAGLLFLVVYLLKTRIAKPSSTARNGHWSR